MAEYEIIGLREPKEECLICKICSAYEMNPLTMDLLLSRRSAEEIVRKYSGTFNQRHLVLTLDDLTTHAEHCDPARVPDDYIFDPSKYEQGENKLLHQERNRRLCREDWEILSSPNAVRTKPDAEGNQSLSIWQMEESESDLAIRDSRRAEQEAESK
jgi:hypothetical protein